MSKIINTFFITFITLLIVSCTSEDHVSDPVFLGPSICKINYSAFDISNNDSVRLVSFKKYNGQSMKGLVRINDNILTIKGVASNQILTKGKHTSDYNFELEDQSFDLLLKDDDNDKSNDEFETRDLKAYSCTYSEFSRVYKSYFWFMLDEKTKVFVLVTARGLTDEEKKTF